MQRLEALSAGPVRIGFQARQVRVDQGHKSESVFGLIPWVLTQILDSCVNGITLSDPDLPDNPIVYANKCEGRVIYYLGVQYDLGAAMPAGGSGEQPRFG